MDTQKPIDYETTDATARYAQTKIAKMVAVLPRIEAARARGWHWRDLLEYARGLLDEPTFNQKDLTSLVYAARRRVAAPPAKPAPLAPKPAPAARSATPPAPPAPAAPKPAPATTAPPAAAPTAPVATASPAIPATAIEQLTKTLAASMLESNVPRGDYTNYVAAHLSATPADDAIVDAALTEIKRRRNPESDSKTTLQGRALYLTREVQKSQSLKSEINVDKFMSERPRW